MKEQKMIPGIPKEEKVEELDKILSESPLYLDMSLIEREKFVKYLACIILPRGRAKAR